MLISKPKNELFLANSSPQNLLWVDFFWGRYNIGAIKFSKTKGILKIFYALSSSIRNKMQIYYWDLSAFHIDLWEPPNKLAILGKSIALLPIDVDPKSYFPSAFCAPPTSMLQSLRQKRSEAFFKINIDEGGGGEIAWILAFLTCFRTGLIAPMFSWIFPTPKKINPYWLSLAWIFKTN